MSEMLLNEISLLNIAGHDNDIKDAFTRAMIAPEEPLDVSTRPYDHANKFFIWKDRKFYKTLTRIDVSESFIVGTNIKEATIGEILAALYEVNPARVMELIAEIEDEEYPIAHPYSPGDYIIRSGILWIVTKPVNFETPWQPGYNINRKYNIGEAITSLEKKSYLSSDEEENTIEDADFIPFLKSNGNRRKFKFSSLITKIKGIFAPVNHADSTDKYGGGTGTLFGHVKLSDSYTTSSGSASQSMAASSKAVNDSYNALNDAKPPKNHASTTTTYGIGNGSNYGHVKLSDSYASNVGNAAKGVGASQKALYDLFTTLNGRISGDVKFSMSKSWTNAPCLVGTFKLDDQTFYLMLYFQYPNQDGNRRLIVFDKDWNTIWQI